MKEPPEEQRQEGKPDSTRRELLRLALALAVLAAGVPITYFVPGLDRARPWVPGDDVPLTRLFATWGHMELPQWAGAGASYRPPEQTRQHLAEQVGEAVAANLGGEAVQPAAVVASGADAEDIRIDPASYAGIQVEIEDPGGRAMAPFYDQLLRTAKREPGALTRISHLGDSSIATDLITFTVRRNLQRTFGDGGHGYVLVARGPMPYGHRDVYTASSRDWTVHEVVRGMDRDGRYGLGGVQVRAGPGAWAFIGTDDRGPVGGRVSSFELYYLKHPRGGQVLLSVDRGEPEVIDTRSDELEDAFYRIEVPDGPHRLEIRPGTGGHARLYGVVMERDGPGVVYDSLGMVGARANRLLHHDPESIAGQVRHRGIHLLVMGFGGNEADDQMSQEVYEDQYTQVLRRMRAGNPDMGCLMVAPLDQGQRRFGGIGTMPMVPIIVAAQEAVARREGCAFYNTFEAMGGEGSVGRWYRSHPRLALGDFRHATPAGYEVIGNMITKALLKGFADYLERRRAESP